MGRELPASSLTGSASNWNNLKIGKPYIFYFWCYHNDVVPSFSGGSGQLIHHELGTYDIYFYIVNVTSSTLIVSNNYNEVMSSARLIELN